MYSAGTVQVTEDTTRIMCTAPRGNSPIPVFSWEYSPSIVNKTNSTTDNSTYLRYPYPYPYPRTFFCIQRYNKSNITSKNKLMSPTHSLHTLLPLMLGAAAGGTLRHFATANVTSQTAMFRVAAVNVAGSFILGTSHSLRRSGRLSPRAALAIGTGFCGALTTFSTFAAQLVDVANEHQLLSRRLSIAGAYVGVSVLLGVAAVVAGRAFGRVISM